MVLDLSMGRQGTLPPDARTSILSTATFKISCEGGGSAVFSELGGISSEVEQAEYMEAGEKGPVFGRFIGRAKPPTVTLKRSMSTGSDTTWIWAWHALARTGVPAAYRDTQLALIPAGQSTPVKTYTLSNAIPTKVEIAGMKAGGTEVVIQTVTLMCDEIVEL